MTKRKDKSELKYGLKIGNTYKKTCELDLNDIVTLYKQFYSINNRMPKNKELNSKNNFPPQNSMAKILKKNNITWQDLYTMINGIDYDNYQYQVNKFIEISKEKGNVLTTRELINNKYGLHSSNWFIANCPDKNIICFNQFLEWCGIIPNRNIGKEKATQIILNKQRELKLNRPLKVSDFKNPNKDEIGIRTIYRHWGNFTKMKKELNLEIIQDDMVNKQRSYEQAKDDINNCCKLVYEKEKRKIITTTDIKRYCSVGYNAYSKVLKKHNTTLREYLLSIGFSLQRAGNGLNYIYNDGEKVNSQYELDFSNYLRNNLNLKYNEDYFREIKYSTFVKDYNGKMNCDYIIYYNGRIIYIEIVGMLRDYKNNWREVKINSKSKIKYIEHLKLKEQLFINNNLEYYLLFPVYQDYKYIFDFELIKSIFNAN